MSRTISIVFAVAVAVLMSACSGYSQFKAKRDFSQRAAHIDESPVRVESRNGGVTIIADQNATDVEIVGTITCRGKTQQEADQRLQQAYIDVSRDTNRTLIIKPVFPGERKIGGDGATFTITLPGANGVNINTSNGAVTVSRLAGDLVVDTSNGPVEVTYHDGDVHVDTSNGGVTLADITGTVFADTSNGRITAVNIPGKATLDTSNGDVDLVLTQDNVGPFIIDTSNGDVDVKLGAAFAGTITMDTSNGHVTVPGVDQVKSSFVNKSGGKIEMHATGESSTIETSNGSITVKVVQE